MKSLNKQRLVEVVKKVFPPVDITIGYGSGFFPQKNHEFTENSLLDLIFIVENRFDFHNENFKMNKSHYSGLGYYGGPHYINTLQKNLCHVHFNPMIEIEEFKVKYGIVSHIDFMRELISWENFVLAGRFHKPIEYLDEDNLLLKGSVRKIIEMNYQFAFVLGVLVNYLEEIPEHSILESIVALSYIGDIRFYFNAESNNKIHNILDGQYEWLAQNYRKVCKENFSEFLEFDEKRKMYLVKDYKGAKEKLIDYVPLEIINVITSKQLIRSEFENITAGELNFIFEKGIKKLNFNSTLKMALYHFLTTSFKKNYAYTKAKIQKNSLNNE